MKKQLLLLAMACMATMFSYANNKFYNNTTNWSELSYSFESVSVDNYYIDNDSIVNGKSYQIVCNDNNTAVALLRTTDEGLVYRYSLHNSSEELIYDFGEWYVGKPLLIDRYINNEMSGDIESCHIAQVNTLVDEQNNTHSYMQAEVVYEDGSKELVNDCIIHGIGSTWDILYGKDLVVMPDGKCKTLMAFERDGKVIYNDGYHIYPLNDVVSTDEQVPLSATIAGNSITISGSVFTGWEENKCAAVSVKGNNVVVYLANTSINLDNCDNYKFEVTVHIGAIESDEINIQVYNTMESFTLNTAGVSNAVSNCTFKMHRQGDILMAVFPAAEPGEAITLYDASGRVVAKQAIRAGATTAGINASSLPAGIYIATLASGASTKIVLTK